MDAHAATAGRTSTPTRAAGTYAKVGLVLFVLTALEVALYEITYGEHAGAAGRPPSTVFVPMLLAALGGQVRAGRDVLHAPQAGQPAVHRGLRFSAHHRRGHIWR